MIKVLHLTADRNLLNLNGPTSDAYVNLQLRPNGDAIRNVLKKQVRGLTYEFVAIVDTDKLDTAYRLTNSIDDYWGHNEGVTEMGSRHRSTSVGDLVVDTKTGKTFVVASFGFEEVGV